jgi:hypothetical protein
MEVQMCKDANSRAVVCLVLVLVSTAAVSVRLGERGEVRFESGTKSSS